MRPAGAERLIPPRQRRQLEARPQRPSSGLGVTMMRWSMIEGKCGLPTLCPVACRGHSSS